MFLFDREGTKNEGRADAAQPGLLVVTKIPRKKFHNSVLSSAVAIGAEPRTAWQVKA